MYISCIIIGIKGFTGKELINLIYFHPNIKYIYLIIRKKEIFIKKIHEEFIKFSIRNIKHIYNKHFNILISCLPNKNNQFIFKHINKNNIKIIDISADFRFKKYNFKKIYDNNHSYNKLQKYFLYGYIEETFRYITKKIQLISNPGCYVNLALNIIFPIIRKNFIKKNFLLINAINGTSGIGRKLKEKFLHYYQYNNIQAYAINGHKHTLEISLALYKYTKKINTISLCTAHGNFTRGIFMFITIKINNNLSKFNKVIFIFLTWFNKKNKFIKIYNTFNKIDNNYKYHSLSTVLNTNFSYISFNLSNLNKEIRFIGSIDNLVKGASGTAIENINILFQINNIFAL